MEDHTWSCGLATASTSYPSKLKSHLAELCIDFEEADGDDELTTAFPCPFCADNFDLLELWCHIDELHSTEAKTGICPLCVSWVGTNLVEHISAQHRNILMISLLSNSMNYVTSSFTRDHSQHKSGYRKLESYQTLSLSRKDLEDGDGYCQSYTAGSSPEISTSMTVRDPLLSFLYNAASADERENVQPDSSSELHMEEVSKESMLARDVQPSLSDKDQMGKAQQREFVQGLLMSTILDSDL
ncbi:protein DEHYDRATION-INDUCED 19-like protein 3-like [Senna tora]|uniref:Protein DEHYDRATION-INDUCED 19-like protein 3-like n=1 Tax=Senna tora TaxID=362788 RepID=A0A834WD50_9FABA|nr:protein DEHYDRATION-INDUCED 19-like protein 3-like [Senna tora]